MSYSLYPCVTAVVTVHDLFTTSGICVKYHRLVLSGMAKSHELLQQLAVTQGILGSIGHSPSLLLCTLAGIYIVFSKYHQYRTEGTACSY